MDKEKMDKEYRKTFCGICGLDEEQREIFLKTCRSVSMDSESLSVEEFLAEENNELRRAGCKLAEAALHVAREHDGVHRLMLAVSEWSKILANEGGRGKRFALPPSKEEKQ